MPPEPDWLKYTGCTSFREFAFIAARNNAIMRAIHLSRATKVHEEQMKRAFARLNEAKAATKRPKDTTRSINNDGNSDLLYDADDECEEKIDVLESGDKEGDETDAIKEGSDEVVPGAEYGTEAESQRDSSKPTPGSENLVESEEQEIHDIGGRGPFALHSSNPNNSTPSDNEDGDNEGYEAGEDEEEE
ncbi:unnamed protein product [Clonostachys solani]|uniref:Uncharacterized protein n=1 Tax=Clonostachys solani TaxID=160281 RepID=A0A9N9Z4M8_9HYPO|nr:unnamed protein product [Clonostachys solani]